MNTSELAETLRQHHIGTPSKPVPGFFIQEIQAPHHSRRADVLWLPLMTGMRGQIWGYELKVSRADLMHELQDPTKADPWMRYCNSWTLVVADEAMLAGLDIPDLWGILVPSEKRIMRTVRKAAVLKPAGQLDAHGTILARLHFGGEDGGAKLARAVADLAYAVERNDAYRLQVNALQAVAAASVGAPGMQERVAKVIGAINSRAADYRSGDYLQGQQVPPELIAEAVVDYLRIVRRAEQIAKAGDEVSARMVEQLRGMADRVQEHRGRLGELSAPLVDALAEIGADA